MKASTRRQPPIHDYLITELIDEHCQIRPDAEAICSSDGQSISYRALDDASRRIATKLLALGVGPEVIVPLCFEKSIWPVIAVVAVLKAGGAFVLLDPAHPTDRLESIISKCRATIAITSRASHHRISQLLRTALPLDAPALAALPPSAHDPSQTATPSNAAYIVYTSGSTGQPKGAVIEHGSFCAGATGHAAAMGMDARTRAVQFASYNFDAAITEMLTTLVVGGAVCVVGESERLDPGAFASAVKRMRANYALLTASFISALSSVADDGLAGLRTLVQGGEALPEALLERWADRVTLMNAYGQVEASVVSTCTAPIPRGSQGKSIGTAVAGRCWVVDPEDANKRIPPGEIGELLVEGPHVGRGYLNEPEKTAAVFIRRPIWHIRLFPAESDARALRFYRTGDLVIQEEDGSFTFAGRKDEQVKVNGQRIEVGEIEHQFKLAMNASRDIVVELVKRKTKTGTRGTLVAFVALGRDWNGDEAAAQQLLEKEMAATERKVREILPSFMIPASYQAIEHVPISINGKVDRKSLRTLGEARLSARKAPRQAHSPPSTGLGQVEEEIRRIWSKVLNVPAENIDRNSVFQSLGGDSISAMQVVSQAAARGLRITMQRILQQKTIESIASGMTVDGLSTPAGAVQADSEEEEEDSEAPFSLSPIQRLFFHLKPEGDNRDNISFLLRLNRNISHISLEESLKAVVSRNPMLRARFFELKRGKWFQYISEDTVESYGISSHTVSQQSEEVMQIIGQSQRSLDIRLGPLIHADLFNIREGRDQLLFVCAHHLVTDFVSFRAILGQIEEHLQTGTISAPPSYSFQKWCKAQQSYVRRLPPQELPFKLPESKVSFWGMSGLPNVYGDSDTEVVVLDKELSSAILGAASSGPLEAEAVDVLLSACMLAFHNVFPERPIPAFFVEGHGREPWDDAIDLSSTVGWFTTILPLVLSQHSCSSSVDALREIRALRATFPDKGLAYFASRYYQRKKDSSASAETPMEVTFNYAGMYQQLERPGSLFSEIPERSLMNLDGFSETLPRFGLVEILGNVDRGHIKLSFTYNRRMRHLDRIRLWMQECRQVLSTMSSQLRYIKPEFPLLRASSAEAARLADNILPRIGLRIEDVEDMYPCSPMQNGMLLSRAGQRGSYISQLFLDVQQRHGAIDLQKLEQAWQALVDRHAVLRTVFVESIRADGTFDQVVLRHSRAGITCVEGQLDGSLLDLSWTPSQPEHQLFVKLQSPDHAILQLNVSHVLIDGSSTQALMLDLQRAYENLDVLRSAPRPLYSNYIKHISTTSHEESVEYWKRHLAGIMPCHVPQWSDISEGSLEFTSMPAFNLHKIKSFCQSLGITISDLLKAVWGLVLRSYTGSESPVFGYLSSGRDEKYAQTLGVFTNIQPCVSRQPSYSTVLDVLKSMQDDSIEQISHRECPLAEIMHATDMVDAAREGLFDTAMSLQHKSSTPTDKEIVIRLTHEMDPTEFAVTFLGYVTDNSLELVIEYLTSKISPFQAENIAETVSRVLRSVIETPNSTIQDLEVVSERDSGTLSHWNSRLEATSPVDSCIHHLIERVTREHPDRLAIDAWDGRLTYTELDKLSSRLAAHLYNLGVRPEELVPVCMEKSAWTTVAMLSVLKAGGAFVPFDPEAPLARLLQLLDDTSASIVIASPKTALRLQEHVQQIVVSPTFVGRLPERDIPQLVTPDNLAYVLFTSGSTGTPKGIMMQHSQFLASSTRYSPILQLDSTSRVLQFSAYTFDASIFEIWSTLTSGGCVCQMSEEQRMNDISGAIGRLGATVMFMTPTMLSIMAPEDVPSIRTVVTGGEVIPQDVFATWAPAVRLIEAYGPTETAVYATFQVDVTPGSDRLSIGNSFCCRPWVVDPETERLLPVGAAGELWLDGPSVARGYLNNEAQTAKAFVTRRDWLEPSRLRRFYRTGDLVRFKKDGSLQFVGRKDTQVKIRGQRVELAEVEHKAALVLGKTASLAAEVVDSKLVLLVEMMGAPDESAASAVALLEAELPQKLPRFMVPSNILPVKEPFPRMSSGKLDRKALRTIAARLGSEQRAARGEGRRAETENERKLQSMLALVLNVQISQIQLGDNFFYLGGDSFLAMKLVAAARAEGMHLSVSSVLRHPVLSDMAKTMTPIDEKTAGKTQFKPFGLVGDLANSMRTEAAMALRLNSVAEIEDIYPATPLQEAFMIESAKNPLAYTAQHVVELPRDSKFDIQRFRAAWETCVQEQPILRTRLFQTVYTKPPKPMQAVLKQMKVDWEQSSNLQEYLKQARNLSAFLFNKVAIIDNKQTGSRKFVWLAHHSLYDGYSLHLLLQRVHDIYIGKTDSKKPVAFRRYMEHLNEVRDSGSAADFWRTYLKGAPTPAFPPPRGRPAPVDGIMDFNLRLPRLARADVTLATTLQASWALVMAACSGGATDVVFGSIVSGRNAPMDGIEEVMGPTITAVPVRVSFQQGDRIHELLLRMQRQTSEMIPHEALGLQNIQALGLDAARACSFGSLFVVQPAQPVGAPYEVASQAIDTGSSFSYPVTVVCEQVDDAVVNFNVTYASGVLSQSQVTHLMGQFQLTVQRLLEATTPLTVEEICIQPVEFENTVVANARATPSRHLPMRASAELEMLLKHLWAECLELDDPEALGADADFLRLGGDSITAMQLSGIARRQGFSLKVVDVLGKPTLGEMALYMTGVEAPSTRSTEDAAFSLMPQSIPLDELLHMAAADTGVQVGDIEDIYPCTPLQEGLMTASNTQAGSYVARLVVELQRASLDQLKAAWQSVVATHPILRTRVIHLGPTGMFQVVIKDSEDSVKWSTGSDLEEYVTRDRNEPMSFGDALSRYGLIMDSERVQFVWTAHHAIYDGATVGIISAAISKILAGSPLDRPPPFSRYIDYLHNLEAAESDRFWRDSLTGARPVPFPLADSLDYKPRADNVIKHGVSLTKKPAGVTTAALIQTAWALVLSRFSCSDDVVYGLVQSGRLIPVPDIDCIPGPTVTTAPLRVHFRPQDTFASILERVQTESANAIPHSHRGLQSIRRVSEDAKEACDFRSLLTMHPRKQEQDLSFDLSKARLVGSGTADFHTYPLLLECEFSDSSALFTATHDARLIKPLQMRQMMRELERVLELLAADNTGIVTVAEAMPNRESKSGQLGLIGEQSRLLELDGRRFPAATVEKLVSQSLWDREVAIKVIGNPETPSQASLAAIVALGHVYVDDDVAKKLLDALASGAQDRLSRTLPSFMVPTVFLPVRSLSDPASQGVSYRQLANKTVPKASTLPNNVLKAHMESASSNAMERRLGELWKMVLGLDEVETHNSFLRLGGDSLDAMKLVAAARRGGILITVKEIFDNPILSDMARIARDAEVRATPSGVLQPFSLLEGEPNAVLEEVAVTCGLEKDAVEDVYPCAPLQEGLMALSNVEKGAYVAEYVVPVPNDEKAEAAWKNLVAMTPVLRTRVVQSERWGFLQVVVKEDAEVLHGTDLQKFLTQARQKSMSPGDRLVRAGIVSEGASSHFVLLAHHAVFDGWAWNLMLKRLYQLHEGQEPPSAPPYSKFIQYIHQDLDAEAAEGFWRSYLKNADRTSFPPTPVSAVPRPDSDETRRITLTRNGSGPAHTMGSIIQTAWALLVSRYTDSEDVVIGVTLSGRTVPVDSIQDMIGPTFTTIPMRFIVNGSSTVSELFDGARSVSVNPAQHIGLQRIKQVSSSAQAACDFNSLLVVQPATQEHDDISDNFFLRENKSELISSFTNYGFVLVCQLLPSGGLDASAVFDSNLISQHQVLRILAQLEHLLQQLCGVEALSVADVDFLSLDDATEVAAYNLLEEPTAESSLCLHQIIEQHAHRQPNSAAISSWDGDFTYGELNSLANKLAGHLIASRKVSLGDIVPLCFEKSKWTLVAMLSVMKAGAAFLLLDPANPVNRLESICNKVKAKVALVSSSLRSLLSHCVREVFVLDQQRADSLPDDLLRIAVDPTDAAYVVTTSGTSGEPKACVIEHRSIMAGAQSFITSAYLDSKTRAMQFASYSFDASIIETLMVWVAGGCTCILSETDRKDNLAAAIAKLQINWSLMTPSLASLLTPKDIPTMKTVVLGGEAATPELLTTWSGSVTLLQAYGPCECTPVACCSQAPLTAASNPRNIGTPLRNVRAWVVLPSNHDKLAPVGSVGELVLEGAIVGRGYIDEPDKTAAAFIAAPEWRCQRFSAAPLQRFYKTGDLVRYGDAGELIFVGRKGAQVKVHGQRLELAEIEHQLRRAMARPCDVAVELVASGSGGSGAPILAAFVAVGHACCSEDEAARQALQGVLGDAKIALANALPAYMVPRVFVPVPVLPLNAAGKVDRKALRQMDSKVDEYYAGTEGEVPVTSTGLVLQTLWARVLDAQVSRIHTAASFTDLGGDSLAAMRLASKAREAGISLSVADIMRQPRFADMEAKCRPLTEAAAVPEYKPFSMFPSTGSVEEFLRETLSVNIRDIEDVIEATSMQKAMTAAAMSPTQGTVNHVWLDFHGTIDLYRLKDACSKVVNHHSILRTVFIPHDEKLLQVVFRSHTPEFDLRHANHGVEDATTALINDNKQQPERFGIHGLRFCFIHNDSATPGSTDTPTGRLVIRTPHNLYDGISLPQILDDLRTAYGNHSALPPSPSFSSHLGSWRHLQRSGGATAFWRQHLSGSRITPITSPDHQPHPSTNPINGHFTRHIPAAALATTPHTFETLLHTAWALVLRHLSKPSANNDDILFARAVANRHLPLPAAASVVGPTLNAVPVRVNLAAHRATPLPRLLAAVADARLAALPHELLETDALARHCTDWPRGARFGSLVVHNAIPAVEEGGAFGGGRLEEWEGGVQAKLGWSVAPWDAADVQITSTPVGGRGGVRVDMVFSDRVVPARVAERMLVGLCRVVEVLGGVEAGDERRWEDVQVEGEEVLGVEEECCLPLELGSCGLGSSDTVLSSSSASARAPSSPGSSYEVVSVEGLGESDGERATLLSAV